MLGDFDCDLYVATVLAADPDTDRIDAAAVTLLAAYELGECSESSVRQAIAALAWASQSHLRAVNTVAGLSPADREELAASVFEIILRKILDNSNGMTRSAGRYR